MSLPYASPEGTARYAARFESKKSRGHFRLSQGLWFSSLGIGSYLGGVDDASDAAYEESLGEALLSGINVADSAINYRAQRSERAFGRALKKMIEEGVISREEVILSTKGGFLPYELDIPPDPELYFRKRFVDSLVPQGELVQGCHSLSPKFLEDQLKCSLENLGVECVDIYFLHNPELQLSEISSSVFRARLLGAFSWLEEKVREGRIRMYGTATWSGYRLRPDQPDYLALEDLLCLAREAGGSEHHFRAIQVPFSLAMPEAWIFPNQRFGAGLVPLLQLAKRKSLTVMASASLMQGRLAGPVPDFMGRFGAGLGKPAQRALQFARSVPGVTTALAGMKRREHVQENLQTAEIAPLTEDELILMFQKSG
ncbi:MAG: aldo/keto reductase [Candidatus Omnitrophica bacterium]|nr:aldo/keto reductase [Candidatus Omnitrophota bacterium]